MEKKAQAIEILDELKNCRPQIFFDKINDVDRGTQFVLGYLDHHNEEVISSNLSNALNVSTARMAKLLNNMEKKGLIKKYTSPLDARKTVVELTNKGKEITSKHKEELIEITMKVIEDVGYDELKEFIRISYKIKESILLNKSLFHHLAEINKY